MSLESDRERYTRAMHAMQSAVAFTTNYNKDTQPKHLRVGVNSALISSSALAQLLIEKGIITEAEYVKKLADLAEEDVEMYKQQLPPEIRDRIRYI